MKKKLYLIRHAEIGPEYQGRYIGNTDIPLSKEGSESARRFGEQLRNQFDFSQFKVFLSPLSRCQQTWEALGIQTDQTPLLLDELREIHFGEWETKSFREIYQSHPQQVSKWAEFKADFKFPGGESLKEFSARLESLKQKLLHQFYGENLPNPILLITHGGVIAALICLFLGLKPSQYLLFKTSRPSLSSLEIFTNGKGILTGLNYPNFKETGEWPG